MFFLRLLHLTQDFIAEARTVSHLGRILVQMHPRRMRQIISPSQAFEEAHGTISRRSEASLSILQLRFCYEIKVEETRKGDAHGARSKLQMRLLQSRDGVS